MKYANIISLMSNHPEKGRKKLVNIGDYLQFYAVEYVLNNVVDRDSIVGLNINDIKSYEGDDLILPLNWNIFDSAYMDNGRFAFPKSVHPVWLAATLGYAHNDELFNDYNITFLKECEPIACRDSVTKDKLLSYGIKAYLVGCMTAILPRRAEISSDFDSKTVFFVDAPYGIKEVIPDKYTKNVRYLTQQYYLDETISTKQIREFVISQYDLYRQNACLCVTSRLHVASPCTAMGIPVIFCKDYIDERFAFLDKLIKLYDRHEYDRIDWNATVPDYEMIKEKIINLQINRIHAETRKLEGGVGLDGELYSQYSEIDSYYCQRSGRKYDDFRKVLFSANALRIDDQLCEKFNYKKDDTFSFAIFGCGKLGEDVYNYISSTYKNAVFLYGIDNYKQGVFFETSIISWEKYSQLENADIVVVSSYGAGCELRQKYSDSKLRQLGVCFASDDFLFEPVESQRYLS